MKFTATTRQALAHRRMARDLIAKGWEEVGEGGGMLWEIHRGKRWGQVIVDARVSPLGYSVFVKIEQPQDRAVAEDRDKLLAEASEKGWP